MMADPSVARSPENRYQPDGAPPRSAPNILDILQAVKTVAPSAPHIEVWWLASRSRLHVSAHGPERPAVDFVVDGTPHASDVADDVIARLSRALGGASVTLRFSRSASDTRAMFRLLTRPRTS